MKACINRNRDTIAIDNKKYRILYCEHIDEDVELFVIKKKRFLDPGPNSMAYAISSIEYFLAVKLWIDNNKLTFEDNELLCLKCGDSFELDMDCIREKITSFTILNKLMS